MSRLRIATWNLERLKSVQGVRHQRQLAWMRQVDADVWVLTETHVGLGLGREWNCVTSGRAGDLTPEERWVGIWSRFPLQPLEVTGDAGMSVGVCVDVPGIGQVVVAGAVLPWRGYRWQGLDSAGGVSFRAALEAHLQDWRAWKASHPSSPFVLAGDLNQDLSSMSYYWSAPTKEALGTALKGMGLECLTAGSRDPVYWQTRAVRASVDHICVDGAGRLGVAAGPWTWPFGVQPDRLVSDHFGAAVDLRTVRPG